MSLVALYRVPLSLSGVKHQWGVQAATVCSSLWLPSKALPYTAAAIDRLVQPSTGSGDAAKPESATRPVDVHQAQWLALLLQHGHILLAQGRPHAAEAAADAVLVQSTQLRSLLYKSEALALRAQACAAQGRTAEALNAYTEVQSARAAAHDTGPRTAELLCDHGCLRESVGLFQDASQLFSVAAELLQQHVASMGLAEEQRNPVRASVYTRHRTLLAAALLNQARVQRALIGDSAAGKCAATVLQTCTAAIGLLPFTRAPPTLHAHAALELGIALEAAKAEGQEAASGALVQWQHAVDIAAAELGCVDDTLRESLLCAAALWLQDAQQGTNSTAAAQAHACLVAARAHAAAQAALNSAADTFEPSDVRALPLWYTEHVRHAEEKRTTSAADYEYAPAQAGAAATVSDAQVKEAAIQRFVELAAVDSSAPIATQFQRWQQAAEVHAALLACCPKYAQTCQLSGVPKLNASASNGSAAVPAGNFAAHWLVRSAAADATALSSKGQLTAMQLLQLPEPPQEGQLLFVAGQQPADSVRSTEGGKQGHVAGSICAAMPTVQALLAGVRNVRFALEAHAAGTAQELLGRPDRPDEQVQVHLACMLEPVLHGDCCILVLHGKEHVEVILSESCLATSKALLVDVRHQHRLVRRAGGAARYSRPADFAC